jgi:hypothetical protein
MTLSFLGRTALLAFCGFEGFLMAGSGASSWLPSWLPRPSGGSCKDLTKINVMLCTHNTYISNTVECVASSFLVSTLSGKVTNAGTELGYLRSLSAWPASFPAPACSSEPVACFVKQSMGLLPWLLLAALPVWRL